MAGRHDTDLYQRHAVRQWRTIAARDREIELLRATVAQQSAELRRIRASPAARLDAAVRRQRLGVALLRAVRLAWWSLSGTLKPRLQEERDARDILASGAFDADWYAGIHADAAASGLDPVMHFLRHGAAEACDPSPTFSLSAYRLRHPQLGRDANPLLDAIRGGRLRDGESALEPWPGKSVSLDGVEFRENDAPEAAIVLDGRDGSEALAQSLLMLADEQHAIALQVILLVAPGAELTVPGARRYFAAAEDEAAVTAAVGTCRAPYIIVVQPGLVPRPGAIRAICDALGSTPSAVMVCGKLLDLRRTVVQAGGSLAPDGSIEPRGVGLPADHFAVASIADVDAAPPGLVGFAGAWLRRIGGHPPGIGGGWSEAAKLAFRIRAEGGAVIYQPLAEAVVLAATEPLPSGDRITQHGSEIIARLARPRALFVDHLTPKPDQDSGSGDTYWLMRIMLGLGYEVTFLPMLDLRPAGRYTRDLRACGIACVTAADVESPEAFLRCHGASFDLAFLHRWMIAEPCLDVLRRVAPHLRVVFNTVDLHFLREQRAAELAGSPEARRQALVTRNREIDVMRRADATIVVSEAEQQLLAVELPQVAIRRIPIVRSVPMHPARPAGRGGVVFVGGFAHPPNIDAMIYFVREVWPLVRQRMPAAGLKIVGSEAPTEILALDDPPAGIKVIGYVKDLEALLAQSRMTVAPLRYGAGIKGKVVTSLLNGVPCIASPMAAEGMGLVEGRDILIARSAEDFVASIARLHADDALWSALSEAGMRFARANFSVERVACLMRDLLLDLELPIGTGVMGTDAGCH